MQCRLCVGCVRMQYRLCAGCVTMQCRLRMCDLRAATHLVDWVLKDKSKVRGDF